VASRYTALHRQQLRVSGNRSNGRTWSNGFARRSAR